MTHLKPNIAEANKNCRKYFCEMNEKIKNIEQKEGLLSLKDDTDRERLILEKDRKIVNNKFIGGQLD